MSFDKKEWSARRYQERKEELATRRADLEWKAKRKAWAHIHRIKNSERLRKYDNARHLADPQKRKKSETKERKSRWGKSYRARHPVKIKFINRRYYSNNRSKIIPQRAVYMRARLERDPEFRLRCLLRSRVREALKTSGARKSARTMELIGCDIPTLRAHLEAQFKPEMTWDNHGLHGWHIDHREPCSRFDLTDPEQQKKCFHYSNLQPLWWYENISKGNKTLCA